MKYCVLPLTGTDNTDADCDIIFTMKDTKLYAPIVTLSEKASQKLSKRFSKWFGRSVYWNEYKTKSEIKDTTNEYKYFLKSKFAGVSRWFVLLYINWNNDVKRYKAR